MINRVGVAVAFTVLVSSMSACKSGGSGVGLPSVSIVGDGIEYSPTGNGYGGIPGSGVHATIPTNRDILNGIETSSSGHGLNYNALMGSDGGGEEVSAPTNGQDGGLISRGDTDASIFSAAFDFDSIYRTKEYEALAFATTTDSSANAGMVREFFGDDVSCASISTSMRSLGQATIDGSRCVVNRAQADNALPNLYTRREETNLKVISLDGLLSEEHRLADGQLPNRIAVERKNTPEGIQVKVALCQGTKPLRGEVLLLEPEAAIGDTAYYSRVIEAVDSSVGALIQESSIRATVRNGRFIDDETHKLRVEFKLLPDVHRFNTSLESNQNVTRKFPFGVLNATYDSGGKKLSGASGYGQVVLADTSLPQTLNLSQIDLDLSGDSSSEAGSNPVNVDSFLSSLNVASKIFVDEKAPLQSEDCDSDMKGESGDRNLFDYYFQRLISPEEATPLVWVPTENWQARNFKSACTQMARYTSQTIIRDDAKNLSIELAEFNCGGEQASDISATKAKPWVESCMLKPPSTIFACAENKTSIYRGGATQVLNKLLMSGYGSQPPPSGGASSGTGSGGGSSSNQSSNNYGGGGGGGTLGFQ